MAEDRLASVQKATQQYMTCCALLENRARSLAPLIGTAIAAPSSIPNMVWETFTDQGVREVKTV